MKHFTLSAFILFTSSVAYGGSDVIGNTKCKDLVFRMPVELNLTENATFHFGLRGHRAKFDALESFINGFVSGLNSAGYSGSRTIKTKIDLEKFCKKSPNKSIETAMEVVLLKSGAFYIYNDFAD